MKILVTGSEGYIGQHLCAMLEKYYGMEVYRLDWSKPSIGKPIEKYIIQDIRYLQDFDLILSDFPDEFDAVIHLAALVRVGESVQEPTYYYDVNINGTLNLLNLLKYKNFIFASTGAAANPNSPYGFSKRVCEDMVREWAPKHTIFRFYNVTGSDGFPATNPDGLFYNLVKAINTGEFNIYGTNYNTKDGTCVREYVHVLDICSALLAALDSPTNDIENLAYNDTRTVKEIVNIFKEVNGVDFQVIYKDARPGDLEAMYLPNPSKLMTRHFTYEQMLKWKP